MTIELSRLIMITQSTIIVIIIIEIIGIMKLLFRQIITLQRIISFFHFISFSNLFVIVSNSIQVLTNPVVFSGSVSFVDSVVIKSGQNRIFEYVSNSYPYLLGCCQKQLPFDSVILIEGKQMRKWK